MTKLNYKNLNFSEIIQEQLKDFIELQLPKISFFRPDKNPKKDWKIFYGSDWDSAMDGTLQIIYSKYPKLEDEDLLDQHRAGLEMWELKMDAILDGITHEEVLIKHNNNILNQISNPTKAKKEFESWLKIPENVVRLEIWNEITKIAREKGNKDIAQCARLYAKYIAIGNQNRNFKYIKDTWEIWQKGYGLLCDFGGVFYVYAKR